MQILQWQLSKWQNFKIANEAHHEIAFHFDIITVVLIQQSRKFFAYTYILSSVWVRLSIFSPLSIIQYVGLYVFSLPISVVMIEIIYIYTLSYYHHQIGSMNYYPLFRVRSWNNGVRCMSFYIITYIGVHCNAGNFSPKLSQQTPNSSPVRARYGVFLWV